MSQLDRKTGVKHLRVRGLAAVSFCATLKAAGINILRAVAFKNSELPGNSALKQKILGLFDLIYAFKERFANAIAPVANDMMNFFRINRYVSTKLAS